jgi:hypothetical protein
VVSRNLQAHCWTRVAERAHTMLRLRPRTQRMSTRNMDVETSNFRSEKGGRGPGDSDPGAEAESCRNIWERSLFLVSLGFLKIFVAVDNECCDGCSEKTSLSNVARHYCTRQQVEKYARRRECHPCRPSNFLRGSCHTSRPP